MTNLHKEMAELSSMELKGTMEATAEERTLAAKFLGRIGGQKSVQSRFKGLTKAQKSELMRKVRLSKTEQKDFKKEVSAMAQNLNDNVTL